MDACWQQCMEGSARLVGWISSPYRLLSPTFSLSSCVSVLEGAGLPEVYVCDSKQEWHFSDNTQNRHTHARAHAVYPFTHTLSLSSCLSPICSLVHKHVSNGIHNKRRAEQYINSIPTNMAEAVKPVIDYSTSDRRQLEHKHARSCRPCWTHWLSPVIRVTTRYPSNCHHGSQPMIIFFASICSFLHCNRHLLTSFLYDLALPCSMNLLWAWQCGFLCRRLEYKYGCCA